MKKNYSHYIIANKINYLFILFFILGSYFTLNAQVMVPFKERTSSFTPSKKTYNVKGNFTMMGNTNLTLQDYTDSKTNGNNSMKYVDIDGDPNTLNSSSSTLVLPTDNGIASSCAKVVYAGLYWTGRVSQSNPNPDTFSVTKGSLTKTLNKRKISFKGPGSATYDEFTATDIYFPTTKDGFMYTAYAEVTSYVKDHGIGEYFAADIALKEGNLGGDIGTYGGWGLIVVYENSAMKNRDITIFDGHAWVKESTTVNYNIPVTGFNSVTTGDVGIKLGIMAGEGDVNYTGDYFKIQKLNSSNYLSLNHTGNTTNNFFNSSIQTGGNARNPVLKNNSGLDISMFNLPNSDKSIIGNNQNSTNFQYGSTIDTYVIFAIAMAVDAYVPEIEGVVSAVSINGSPAGAGPYTALPGQQLEYKIQIKNRGTEPIKDTKITIPIPYNTTYVANSAQKTINFSPNPTPNNLTFEPTVGANGSIVWDFGTLPLPANNDPNTVLAELSFKFNVTEDCTLLKNANCNNVVLVNGLLNGVGVNSLVSVSNKSLIQGYTSGGNCEGNVIPAPHLITINAADFVNTNCQSTPPITSFTFCKEATTIPITDITGAFPLGSTFYSSYPIVTGSTIEYTINNPFPAVVGTSTYYAVPPGVSNGCYFEFKIIVTDITSQPSTTNIKYCIDDVAQPLTATASNPDYTLYYYTTLTSSAQTSITPSTTTAGEFTYYVAEGQTNSCIGPKKELKVLVYPKPLITGPTNTTIEGCSTSAITNLAYSETAVNITLSQLTTAGGSFSNNANVGMYSLSYIDTKSGTCPIIVNRTFQITSACGITSVSQTITIKDTTPPVISNTAGSLDTTVLCSADVPAINISAITATDNCQESVIISHVGDETISGTCANKFSIIRTYKATDVCGNSSEFIQNITVNDNILPTIICPTNIIVNTDLGTCGASNVTLGNPTIDDNCSTPTVTNNAPAIFPIGDTIVTWTVTDACGNKATCSQIVTVSDDDAPVIACAADVNVNTNEACTYVGTIGNATATDNCDASVTITNNAPAAFPIGTTTVIWTATDDAGNTTTCSQIVTVSGPIIANDDSGIAVNGYLGGISFTNVLTNDTLDCKEIDPQDVTISYISSTNPGITLNGYDVIVAPGTPSGNYTLTYEICKKLNPENCDTAIVTVIVNAAAIVANDDLYSDIACTSSDILGNILANDTLSDNSVTTSTVNFSLISGTNPNITIDAIGNVTITSGIPAGTYTLTYQICEKLNVENCATATVTVIIIDNTAPIIAQLPAATTISCETPIVFSQATASDTCSTVTLSFEDVTTAGSCAGSYSITRTWTAKDLSGNSSTASQTITVQDLKGPTTTTEFTPSIDVSCDAIPSIPELVFVDNCSAVSPALFTENIINRTVESYSIVRKWEVSDACDNKSEFIQIINVTIANSTMTITSSSCNSDSSTVNLFDLLPEGTPSNGTWIDLDNTNALVGNIFTPFGLTIDEYSFEYKIADESCPRSITVIMSVNNDCEGVVLGCGTILVHNAFSPNGDAFNQKFVIDNIDDAICYPENTVEIYNRWGVLVFETKNYNNETNYFDGTSSGRTTISQSSGLPTGTYFYILNYTSFDGNNNIVTNKKDGYLYLSK
nr:gliding motility-associated C-terminal domain-containing protein [uncultured Flavobacterium sp.]